MTLKSYFLLNYPERAFAFVFREVKQYSSTADGTSLKRKAGIFMCCLEDDKHIDLFRDYFSSWILVLLLLAVDILIYQQLFQIVFRKIT